MNEKKLGVNIVSFSVVNAGKKKYYVIENGLICQLPPEKRILLIQKTEEKWEGKAEENDIFHVKKCFSEGTLEKFLREGQKVAESIVGESEMGYTWKFLRSEMNRLFFGSLGGFGFNHNFSGKKELFLKYLYREVVPEGSIISINGAYLAYLTWYQEENRVEILDSSLKNLQDMINLLIKKKEISIPISLHSQY